MRIKIKALDDIEFVSARLDIENTTIHIEAINLLDLTGKDCIHKNARVENTLHMDTQLLFMRTFM